MLCCAPVQQEVAAALAALARVQGAEEEEAKAVVQGRQQTPSMPRTSLWRRATRSRLRWVRVATEPLAEREALPGPRALPRVLQQRALPPLSPTVRPCLLAPALSQSTLAAAQCPQQEARALVEQEAPQPPE